MLKDINTLYHRFKHFSTRYISPSTIDDFNSLRFDEHTDQITPPRQLNRAKLPSQLKRIHPKVDE